MKHPDELQFIEFILRCDGRIPFYAQNTLSKRQDFFLEKWSDRGLWEYGTSLRSGWLTESGKAEFQKYQPIQPDPPRE